MILFKILNFNGIVRTYLSLEVIIKLRTIHIHKRSGWICLLGIAKHIPVGIVFVNDAGCNIYIKIKKITFRLQFHRGTRAVLFAI